MHLLASWLSFWVKGFQKGSSSCRIETNGESTARVFDLPLFLEIFKEAVGNSVPFWLGFSSDTVELEQGPLVEEP
jgi:hypothetical protein